jgi:hypothetical protein
MAVETLLIPGLLEAMGLTAAASAKKIDVPEGYVPGKGLAKIAKKLSDNYHKSQELVEEAEKDTESKADKHYNNNSNDNKDPDNKDKAAGAALTAEKANELKNKIGDPRERANFKGDPAYLEGKELAETHKIQDSRDQLDRARNSKWEELDESKLMGNTKKPSKISSKGAVDATRKHPVPSVDERKLASEQNSALTTARAKATEKNPIIQKSSDIQNDRTRQDMKNKYPTEEDPINKIKGVKEEISPSFGKYFSVLGIPGMLGAISKVLPLSGADAQEVEISDIEDYLKELKKYADSDDPEDKKIFEEMLKEYEEETGHDLFKDLEEGSEKEDSKDKKDSKKLSPKPELLDRI